MSHDQGFLGIDSSRYRLASRDFLLKALMYSVISVATLFIYTHLLTASAAFKTNIKKAVVVAWPLSVELYADIFGLHYIYTYIYTNIQTLKQLAKTENRRY